MTLWMKASLCLTGIVLLLSGCRGIPAGAEAVEGFDLNRYLGIWYEIARLDHPFERGLTHVTAEYTLQEDGSVRVLNRGYDPSGKVWKEAEGRARLRGSSDAGRLTVSFFGPFYSGYNIIALDHDQYRYALVAGSSRKYLWILARDPDLDKEIRQRLIEKAAALDFPVEELIFVDHR